MKVPSFSRRTIDNKSRESTEMTTLRANRVPPHPEVMLVINHEMSINRVETRDRHIMAVSSVLGAEPVLSEANQGTFYPSSHLPQHFGALRISPSRQLRKRNTTGTIH